MKSEGKKKVRLENQNILLHGLFLTSLPTAAISPAPTSMQDAFYEGRRETRSKGIREGRSEGRRKGSREAIRKGIRKGIRAQARERVIQLWGKLLT